MTATFGEVKAIADTLPIGFYAKRRIPVVLNNDETSTYNIVKDTINVSYSQICQSLKKVDDSEDKETYIRSNLYHEVSHGILTPKRFHIDDINNIFEDERIETLLNDYYLDVNFKNSVFYMNGYKSVNDLTAPNDAMEAFYQTVRFRFGKPQHIAEVDKIIKDFSDLSISTYKDCYGVVRYNINDTDYYYDTIRDYEVAIRKLYDKIAKDYNSAGSASKYFNDVKSSMGANGNNAQDCSANGENAENVDSNSSQCINGKGASAINIGEMINAIFNGGYINKNLTDNLFVILDSFIKKNCGGSCLNGYSGVLNPRNLIHRQDYRIFDRKSSVKGSNTFGTFHLNLFVDDSGSFMRNMVAVNTLIKSLSDIENVNPNFKLDIIHCGMGQKIITDKNERFITCMQGTHLSAEIFEQFRSLQKPNTYNYNILLYDGYAAPSEHAFSAFNTNNTTIISDPENKSFLAEDCGNARVIITENYVEELYDNVKSALHSAFR